MLEDLSPRPVFHYFEELTKIPRCSGSERQASDYLVGFAREHTLEVLQDAALNIVIKKPGTAGHENSPAVIIQGHMDMVCEKTRASHHDFAKDPLILKVNGDTVRADSTTLGADNGIAVAYALALLDSTDIPHPPLEVLITTGEETGMFGVAALDASNLSGKTLLNIDAENEGVFFVSCAGGVDIVIEFETEWEKADDPALLIGVSGLIGGHSGMEIVRQRANAIKILGRVLDAARQAGEFRVAAISGGSKSNAIAREASATITARADVLARVATIVSEEAAELKREFGVVDPDIEVTALPADHPAEQLDRASTDKLVSFLVIAPTGVQSMSQELEGLVESSLNLGVLAQSGKSIELTVSVRSSVDSLMREITGRIEALSALIGASTSRIGVYPAWRYEAESPIRDLCVRVYKEVTGAEPEIRAIHAGLECGLLKQKLPDTDMISFGPNLYNVHTTDEHLSIGSVATTWKFLAAVLKEIKEQ